MLLNHYPTINVPPYYFTGPRKLQVLHTRLRTESSCLKDHLFSKNIVDSTTCQCGLVENSTHCFLQCQRLTAQREIILASMSPLLPPNNQCSTNLLLYGHTDLSLETNILIFKDVYKYQIHKTLWQLSTIHHSSSTCSHIKYVFLFFCIAFITLHLNS